MHARTGGERGRGPRVVLSALVLALAVSWACSLPGGATQEARSRTNLVLVLADARGYGELGGFGQERIQTPCLDALSQEGLRLTSFYAGSTVCAPSRAVLMTGQHTGRTWVRGNGGGDRQTLRAEDVTVAEVLRDAGYATALFGKWGLGEIGTSGHPNAKGFETFFGYLNQRHAHNYYPEFLIRNTERVALRNVTDPRWTERRLARGAADVGAGYAAPDGRIDYSHDLVVDEALAWLGERTPEQPFFLFLALTVPHANNEGRQGTGNGQEVPDHGPYAALDWTEPNKGQAAMITRLDRDVGRLRAVLEARGLARRTLVLFSSDNGPHAEGGQDPEFFRASGPLRGLKRSLTEGGIRVPTIAWWPGTIAPDTTSDLPFSFADVFATAAELAEASLPPDTQSVSFAPVLRGEPAPPVPEFLYWEFYEQGSRQAVRFGDTKAIREPMVHGPIQVYDLAVDPGEERDLADSRPELVARARALLEEAHEPNPRWRVPPEK